MKKKILMFAVVAGFMAAPVISTQANNIESIVVTLQEDLNFSSIAITNLPTTVKNAALKATEGMLAISEAKVATTDEGTQVYKVILTDGQGSETTLYYNEDGTLYKK